MIKDAHQWHQIFNEGDLAMVYLRKDWFPRGTYHKLKYKKIGPCKVLKKINDRSYKVDLPVDINISPTFKIYDLHIFHGVNMGDDTEADVDWKQAILRKKKKNSMHNLDKKTLHTGQGQCNWYLVQWEELAPTKSTWII